MMKYKIIYSLLLVISFYGFAPAQEKDTTPLRYKLVLDKLDKEKKTLSVTLIVKNVTDNKVAIDKNGLGYQVTFEREGEKLPDGGITGRESLGAIGDPSDNYTGDYLVLSPGETYRKQRTFSLTEAFFEKGKTFVLSLAYGQFLEASFESLKVWKGSVDSNELHFDL